MQTRRVPLAVRLIPFVIVVWLSAFLYRFLDDLARHRSGTAPMRAFEEFTGVLTALVIVPISCCGSRAPFPGRARAGRARYSRTWAARWRIPSCIRRSWR